MTEDSCSSLVGSIMIANRSDSSRATVRPARAGLDDPLARQHQQFLAVPVAERAVDLGQDVQVDQCERTELAAFQRLLRVDRKTRAAAQPGHRVPVRLVAQVAEQVDVLQRGAHVHRQRAEELLVLLGELAPPAEPVADLDVAAHPAAAGQRHDHHGARVAGGQCVQHLGIGVLVRRHPDRTVLAGQREQWIVRIDRRHPQLARGVDGQRDHPAGHTAIEEVARVVQQQHRGAGVVVRPDHLHQVRPAVEVGLHVAHRADERVELVQVRVPADHVAERQVDDDEHADQGRRPARDRRAWPATAGTRPARRR